MSILRVRANMLNVSVRTSVRFCFFLLFLLRNDSYHRDANDRKSAARSSAYAGFVWLDSFIAITQLDHADDESIVFDRVENPVVALP